MNTPTTIAIEKRTRDILAKIGDKDSTFDSIICQLLKKAGMKN